MNPETTIASFVAFLATLSVAAVALYFIIKGAAIALSEVFSFIAFVAGEVVR